MPIQMRENRRSYYGSKNCGQFIVEKSRPISWYSPAEIDPYTSVRKIFYEFPKKDFNGDSVAHKTNGLESLNSIENKKNAPISLLRVDNKNRSPRSSPTLSIRSNDSNNNIFSKPHFSSHLFPNSTDEVNLKVESSLYANFYVPNSSKPNRSQISRFSSKRKSFDPSKLKMMKEETLVTEPCDFKKRSSQDLSQSIETTISTPKSEKTSTTTKISKETPIMTRKCNKTTITTKSSVEVPFVKQKSKETSFKIQKQKKTAFTPKNSKEMPIKSRNCNGTSISYVFKHDNETHADNHNESNIFTSMEIYVPWTKRSTLLETNFFVREQGTFSKRRNGRKFSSLRIPNIYSKQKNFPSLKRSPTFDTNTLNSYSNLKTRRLSSLSLTSRQSSDSQISNLSETSSKREKKFVFLNFFSNYQDRLRNLKEFPDSRDLIMLSTASKLYPELLKLFEVDCNLTYRHIFYVRSRLSKSAINREFQCDGCYGCEEFLINKESINM